MKEKQFTPPQRCGHCANVAPMEIVADYAEHHSRQEEDGDIFQYSRIYQLISCPACYQVMLRSYWWHDDIESEADIKSEILYPLEVRLPPGLPPAIEKAFASALKVKSVDSNAFGVMIGRVLELICSERKASGNFLADKLNDLATRGDIPAQLVGIAKGLKDLRNVGAHPDLGELTAEEVPIVEDLCRALLDYLYAAPFLTQRAVDQLSALRNKSKPDSK
jgi:hypothetical protein